MTSSSSSRDFLRVGHKMLKIRKRKKASKQFPDGGEKIWRQKNTGTAFLNSDISKLTFIWNGKEATFFASIANLSAIEGTGKL